MPPISSPKYAVIKQDPRRKNCTKNCAESVPKLPKSYEFPEKTKLPFVVKMIKVPLFSFIPNAVPDHVLKDPDSSQ